MKLYKKITKMIRNDFRYDLILLFTTTFFIYANNLSSSVYGGDSGDFLAAVSVRGVPHPSGYPLYTLFGILFSHIPLNTTAWRVGVVSALFASLSLSLLYLITYNLSKNRIVSLITSYSLAFIYPFWIFAETTEVFSLQAFFIFLICFISIKIIKKPSRKLFNLLIFTLGLSLTNNLSIVLLFPSVFLFVLLPNFKQFLSVKRILKSIFLFLLGLLPYIYIPIAASKNPAINWGYASTIRNFYMLVTRADYGWGKSLAEKKLIPIESLTSYLIYWKQYLIPLIPILSLIGIFYLSVKYKYRLTSFILVTYLFLGPFYLLYSRAVLNEIARVAVVERFYFSSILIIFITVPFGVIWWTDFIKRVLSYKRFIKLINSISLLIFISVPIILFTKNYRYTNLRNIYIGDNFAKDILIDLPENSVVFLATDTITLNSLYLQQSQNFRKDLIIPGGAGQIDRLLVRGGTHTEEEAQKLMIENRNSVPKSFVYLNLIIFNETDVPVYGENASMFDELDQEIYAVPLGILNRFYLDKSDVPTKEEYIRTVNEIWNSYQITSFKENRDLVEESFIFSDIRRRYAIAMANTASFIANYYEDPKLAMLYMINAIDIDPTFNDIFVYDLDKGTSGASE